MRALNKSVLIGLLTLLLLVGVACGGEQAESSFTEESEAVDGWSLVQDPSGEGGIAQTGSGSGSAEEKRPPVAENRSTPDARESSGDKAQPTPEPTVTLIPGALAASDSGSGGSGGGDKETGRGGGTDDKEAGQGSGGDKTTPEGDGETDKTTPDGDGTSDKTSDGSGGGSGDKRENSGSLVAVGAPRWSQTPVQDEYSSYAWRNSLVRNRTIIYEFNLNWLPVLRGERTRNDGDCGTYQGMYQFWTSEAVAFTEVPARLLPQYNEYRRLLQRAVDATAGIRADCGLGAAGAASEDPVSYFPYAYDRVLGLLEELFNITP